MSKCIEKRIEALLHHYELGLLTDDERREVELHLMDCDQCLDKVKKFHPSVNHINFNPRMRELIERITCEAEEIPGQETETAPTRKFSSTFVSASLVAAVVLVLLILKPWQLEINPSSDALAGENRLAVMYFDNLVDEDDSERLGEIITNLLITDLSESQYIRVVSSQRLHDILHLLGQDNARMVDKDIASKVAEKARVKWILTGDILQREPRLVLKYEIVEVASGNVVVSDRISGLAGEEVFSLIDRFTVDIKKTLSLPAEAGQEPDRDVADVTTHSPEAYRCYLEARELAAMAYYREASDKFLEALEFDSTFAMAYCQLARLEGNSYIDRAVQYSANSTRLEKYYIEALHAVMNDQDSLYIALLNRIIKAYPEEKEAYRALGVHYYEQYDYETAIEYFKKAIKIDPLFKQAQNLLAYTYDRMGDFENSILAIDRYISMDPEEANPYDSRGDIYARNGRPEEAKISYREALDIKPDFYVSLLKLGHMNLYTGNFAVADSCYAELTRVPDSGQHQSGSLFRIYRLMYQGKFDSALVAFEKWQEDVYNRDPEANTAYIHRLRAFIYSHQGKHDLAVQEIEISIAINLEKAPRDNLYDRHFYAHFLARNGDVRKAREIVKELKIEMEAFPRLRYAYYFASGAVAMAENDAGAAVDNFEKTVNESDIFPSGDLLASAYLRSGQLSQAVEELEKRIGIYDEGWRLSLGIWNIKMHYLLGLAYEQSRWEDRAIEQYQIFLDFWGGGDPGNTEVEDARGRLNRLNSQS
jgi:tetratricopeptide (TPR) repeat protein